ncbi:MAG: AbrB/MazE/SpoVT family DNA-binding domain-containing protein [Dehalococcoidia bacterium]|nr:AbrB/MazE/SpoVT family DNA-binding domain-containing protein [Dehalococcoidia bacterium]
MARSSDGEVRIGPQGRLVIPATLRKTLGLRSGDRLMARVEDGCLVLETREHILARVKARFAKIPSGVSLVEELLAERRAEALREEEA